MFKIAESREEAEDIMTGYEVVMIRIKPNCIHKVNYILGIPQYAKLESRGTYGDMIDVAYETPKSVRISAVQNEGYHSYWVDYNIPKRYISEVWKYKYNGLNEKKTLLDHFKVDDNGERVSV